MSNLTVPENSPIGTLSAVDPDVGDTFTFAFAGGASFGDNALFTIVGNELRTAASFDYESCSSYSIGLRVTDAGGLSHPNAADTAPIAFFDNGTYTDVTEESTNLRTSLTTAGFSSTTFSGLDATDWWTATSTTNLLVIPELDRGVDLYSALSTDARTSIRDYVGAGGGLMMFLTNRGPLVSNFLDGVFGFSVGTETSLYGVAQSLNAAAAGETDFAAAPDVVPGSDAVMGVPSATLPTGSKSIYQSGGTSSVFTVPYGSGTITVLGFDWYKNPTPAAWQTVLEMAVTATRGTDVSAFTISVTNVNATPTDIYLSAASVAENNVANAAIGTLSTADPDAGNTFAYALVTGTGSADNAFFTISGNQLLASASFNFEAKSSYSIRVRSTDQGGLAVEKIFAIAVTNVAEPISPPVASLPATFFVVEDQPSGLLLASTPFTDADSPLSTTMTVTLRVPDGALSATTGDGVTVAGTARVRTFTGTLAALNAYVTAAPARIIYTPAANNTADRTLSVTIRQPNGTSTLSSSATARIAITPVNDAPTLSVPASFKVTEDVKGNLIWPSTTTPFADVDSPMLTVTLAVQDGIISAATGTGVTVAGTDTVKTFAGTTAALNAYFKGLGKIAYTTAKDNTVARSLMTTVSDGLLVAVRTSTISIKPVNDAPTIGTVATLAGVVAGTPFEITYDALRAASNAADPDGGSPSLMITKVDSGTLQRWSGTAWVAVSSASSSPTAASLLAPGQKLRWTPPVGLTGDRPAFKVKAWDGSLASSAIAQVVVRVG